MTRVDRTDDPPAATAPDKDGHRGRLRTRLIDGGADALADYELIEVILFAASPRGDTKPLAKRLLREFRTVAGVLSATVRSSRRRITNRPCTDNHPTGSS